jgi:hypothetical protein
MIIQFYTTYIDHIKHNWDASIANCSQPVTRAMHHPVSVRIRSDSISGSHGHFSEPSGIGISSISYVSREYQDTEVYTLSSVVQALWRVNKILNLTELTKALGESN